MNMISFSSPKISPQNSTFKANPQSQPFARFSFPTQQAHQLKSQDIFFGMFAEDDSPPIELTQADVDRAFYLVDGFEPGTRKRFNKVDIGNAALVAVSYLPDDHEGDDSVPYRNALVLVSIVDTMSATTKYNIDEACAHLRVKHATEQIRRVAKHRLVQILKDNGFEN